MSGAGDERMKDLEGEVRALVGRVAALERELAPGTLAVAHDQEAWSRLDRPRSPGATVASEAPSPAPLPPAPVPRTRPPAPSPVPRGQPPASAPVPRAQPTAPQAPRSEQPAHGWPSVATRGRSGSSLEDLFGGRVLAWAGGVAVFLGVAFFVSVAIRRGWIDEGTRIALAFAGSMALLGLGTWLGERYGRNQASLAMVGTAVGAMFLTLTAATQLYDLMPVPLALLVALAVGGVATAVAVRFRSPAVAGLGIVGALLAPVLVDAGTSGEAVAFMAVALVSATGVLVWRRWNWLALTAFAVSTPQLIGWAADERSVPVLLAVLFGFGAINLVAALGYEARVPTAELRPSSALLVLASAMVVSGAGYGVLSELLGRSSDGDAWIAVVAALHVGLGIAAVRSRRIARPLGVLLVATGVLLANVAFGLAADGALLAGGWSVASVVFAVVARRQARDAALAQVGIGGQLVLSILHILMFDAPLDRFPNALTDLPGAATAIGSLALGAVLSARFVPDGSRWVRQTLDALGLVALAYLAVVVLDDLPLVLALSAQAAVLVELGRRTGDEVARMGGLAFLGLAAAHAVSVEAPLRVTTYPATSGPYVVALAALVAVGATAYSAARIDRDDRTTGALDGAAIAIAAYTLAVALGGAALAVAWTLGALGLAVTMRVRRDDLLAAGGLALLVSSGLHALALEAPPSALERGVPSVLGAIAALGALAAGCLVADRASGGRLAWVRRVLEPAGVVLLVYLGSVVIVSGFQPDRTLASSSLLDLDVRQQGQVMLSAFWGLAGLAALVAGLARDERRLRLGGLGLLVVAFGKVFLYDLATLDSIYRVLSFIGLGLLLLAGAFAYQRLRPQTPRIDLRRVDAAG